MCLFCRSLLFFSTAPQPRILTDNGSGGQSEVGEKKKGRVLPNKGGVFRRSWSNRVDFSSTEMEKSVVYGTDPLYLSGTELKITKLVQNTSFSTCFALPPITARGAKVVLKLGGLLYKMNTIQSKCSV